jgi:hypothetical protein
MRGSPTKTKCGKYRGHNVCNCRHDKLSAWARHMYCTACGGSGNIFKNDGAVGHICAVSYVPKMFKSFTWLTYIKKKHWHCATTWTVAGSIPHGVAGIFHWRDPPGRSKGSTQPLTEISTRNICWRVKAAGVLGWQTYHNHVSTVLKSGSLNLLEPQGLSRPVWGLLYVFYKQEHTHRHTN